MLRYFKYEEEKKQLAFLIDEMGKEKDKQFEELGYCTTTRGWSNIEDWVESTIDDYRYSGAGWWERNWFPIALLALIAVGMLAVGLVNGVA